LQSNTQEYSTMQTWILSASVSQKHIF